MTRPSCSQLSPDWIGTSRLRRRNPTAFSTDPFSWPEYGLQKRTSILWCAMNEANTSVSVTEPSLLLWPAPVALSMTSTGGTPPIRPNTASSPAHRHSAFSAGIGTHRRMFENGSETTSTCASVSRPASMTSAWPKSTCISPACQARSRNPSESARCSSLHRFT